MCASLGTKNLVKSYKGKNVVNGITLQVEAGSVIGLLGPNGAGKTTTFYSIAGFIRPDSGEILLNGQDITLLPIHARARAGISYLAQEPSVFKKLSVEENVRIVLEPLGISLQEINKRLQSLMEDLKIAHLANNPARSLSGGERRRVEIMRTLATTPQFVLLDEPFAGIDPLSVADLQHIITELKKKGLGILISDHNVRETLTVCDRAYIVSNGKILTSGTAEEILHSEDVRKNYLGDHFKL